MRATEPLFSLFLSLSYFRDDRQDLAAVVVNGTWQFLKRKTTQFTLFNMFFKYPITKIMVLKMIKNLCCNLWVLKVSLQPVA